MPALRPEDHRHSPAFAAAVGAVATRSTRHTEVVQFYRAVQTWLEAEGMPTIPLGSFSRLLSEVGHPVINTRLPDGKRIKFVKHLAIKESS